MYFPHKKGTYAKFLATFSAHSDTIRHNVDGQRGLITSSGHGQDIQ